MHTVANPADVPCKICEGPSGLFGLVDFSKNCEEITDIALSGLPVYYRRCRNCGFIYTTDFDHWTAEDWSANVYNDDYITFDPEYVEKRPAQNAKMLINTFKPRTPPVRLLDYGSGTGHLAKILNESGFDAADFDPFVDPKARPQGLFDVVTAFEVMEHTPTPLDTLRDIASFLNPNGVIIYSTTVAPPIITTVGVAWKYISPRNGHVSIHTTESLQILHSQVGLNFSSFSNAFHIGFTDFADFTRLV